MNTLNNNLLKSSFEFPEDININNFEHLPEKVLQFGEGNFLRGFVDWKINKLNENNVFNGRIVVAQPLNTGLIDILNEQNGLYTLLLRGLQNNKIVQEKQIISSISRGINIYENFDEYLQVAENPELRVIISNTTEAGIAYDKNDKLSDRPQNSFPGKLTSLLYKRFKFYNGSNSKGLIVIPCELIDRNGDNLKKIILQYAEVWNLGNEFIDWINNSNYFLNTLVDRIVTGYPKNEISELEEKSGYSDKLINTGEIFHLWVIEGEEKLSKELPFADCGLNVVWTTDMTPYRTRKVRILNGAHTMTVLAAYLYGLNTVKECTDNEIISSYLKKGIFEEIIPTLDLPENELNEYANAVLERFANPFIQHNLLDISLNSTSKFKTRVLPSILKYIELNGKVPNILSFSLAALIAFYKGYKFENNVLIGKRFDKEYQIKDTSQIQNLFLELWNKYENKTISISDLVTNVLSNIEIWETNLNEVTSLNEKITTHLNNILELGIEKSLKNLL